MSDLQKKRITLLFFVTYKNRGALFLMAFEHSAMFKPRLETDSYKYIYVLSSLNVQIQSSLFESSQDYKLYGSRTLTQLQNKKLMADDDDDANRENKTNLLLISELDVALEALTKPPIRRNNVESCFGSSIAKLNFERERLTIEVGVALPVSSPVS